MRAETKHELLVRAGMIPLLVAMACLYGAGWIMARADRVLPDARRGNCWSYSLARWWPVRDTTHIRMRDVREAKLYRGHGNALHAAHVAEDGTATQTEPDERYRGDSLGGRALYFGFYIKGDDRGHP